MYAKACHCGIQIENMMDIHGGCIIFYFLFRAFKKVNIDTIRQRHSPND